MASHQKTVQQKQFCRGQCDIFKVSMFQGLWQDPRMGVRNSGRVGEWIILQAIHSEECYFSARPLSKYLVVGRSKVFSSWIWRAALLLPSERLSTCLNRVLSWGEVGIVLESWVLPSLSTSKTRACSWSCLELVPARKWLSKLSPQSLPHWTWLK